MDLDVDPVMVVKDAKLQDLVFEAVESIIMLLQVCMYVMCTIYVCRFTCVHARGPRDWPCEAY